MHDLRNLIVGLFISFALAWLCFYLSGCDGELDYVDTSQCGSIPNEKIIACENNCCVVVSGFKACCCEYQNHVFWRENSCEHGKFLTGV